MYLEPQFLDEEFDTSASWYCKQIGKKFHQGCMESDCECDCHWDDPEDL